MYSSYSICINRAIGRAWMNVSSISSYPEGVFSTAHDSARGRTTQLARVRDPSRGWDRQSFFADVLYNTHRCWSMSIYESHHVLVNSSDFKLLVKLSIDLKHQWTQNSPCSSRFISVMLLWHLISVMCVCLIRRILPGTYDLYVASLTSLLDNSPHSFVFFIETSSLVSKVWTGLVASMWNQDFDSGGRIWSAFSTLFTH